MKYIKEYKEFKFYKITIADKRFCKETDKSYTFITAGYGGKFFNIAKSQVISKNKSSIPVNDVYSEPATQYAITKFMYERIKEYLNRMGKYDLVVVEE